MNHFHHLYEINLDSSYQKEGFSMSLNWSFQRLVIVRSQLYYTNAGATRGTVVSIKVVKYIQKCIYCMYVFTILGYLPKVYI